MAVTRVGPGDTVGVTAPGPEAVLGARDRSSGIDLVALAALLSAVGEASRLAAAADDLGISYRTAWARLVAAEAGLGLKLVDRTKGHGSRLSPDGLELLSAVDEFRQAAQARLAAPLTMLGRRLAAIQGGSSRSLLRLVASHDLVLQQAMVEGSIEGITLSFAGSDDALRALVRGEADLAGFHRPVDERPESLALRDGGPVFLIPLMRREQGLIVASGNPKRLRDVTDLARSGVRFVNRQRGAGTRRWLDRLLQEKGVEPGAISGYRIEEATHLAVAAAVAAGVADVGFGLRAAAQRFGLDFVTIGLEEYCLAGAATWREDPRVRALISNARGLAASISGYRPLKGAAQLL
jgi:putative molybdopterin biosynthesis protein